MRIAFLADAFLLDESTGVNGTQVQMYNLAKSFAGRGIQIHYIAQTNRLLRRVEQIHGMTVHWLPRTPNLLLWPLDGQNWFNALNEIQPDVVYQRGRSHLTWIAQVWSSKRGKRFVWASNGEDSCDRWKHSMLIKRARRSSFRKAVLYPAGFVTDLLVHRAVKNADACINQTLHQKSQLRLNYGKDGVVLPSIYLRTDPAEEASKGDICLWLANLGPAKQPELFVKLACHCRSLAGWRFVLAGGTADPNYSALLYSLAADSGNIELLGSVPFSATGGHFMKSSLYVNTSRMDAEGLPNAMIQAWMSGTPVLSLNHDPNGWIAAKGLGYCAQGDLAAFLEAGRRIMADRESLWDMGERCRRFAEQTFASPTLVAEYEAIFRGGNKEHRTGLPGSLNEV